MIRPDTATLVSHGQHDHQADSYPPAVALEDLGKRISEFAATALQPLAIGVWHPVMDLCLVALVGELRCGTTEALTRRVDSLGLRYPCCMVVDLSGLTFIDSRGVETLLLIAKENATKGCTMLLAAPSQRIAGLVELTRLADAIRLTCSLQTAIRHSGTNISFPRHFRDRMPGRDQERFSSSSTGTQL